MHFNAIFILSVFLIVSLYFIPIIASGEFQNHFFWSINSPSSDYSSSNWNYKMPTDFDGNSRTLVVGGGLGRALGFTLINVNDNIISSYTINFNNLDQRDDLRYLYGISFNGTNVFASGMYKDTDGNKFPFIVCINTSNPSNPMVEWGVRYKRINDDGLHVIEGLRLLRWGSGKYLFGLASGSHYDFRIHRIVSSRYLIIINPNSGNLIYAIKINNEPISYQLQGTLPYTGGIAVDIANNIYVTDHGVTKKIEYSESNNPPFDHIYALEVSGQKFFDLKIDRENSHVILAGANSNGYNGDNTGFAVPCITNISTNMNEVSWSVLIYNDTMNSDEYSYGIAIHSMDNKPSIIFWVGGMIFDGDTKNHPFISYVNSNGNTLIVYEVPMNATDADYGKGVFSSVYDLGGLPLIAGVTDYIPPDSRKSHALSILLFSESIAHTLDWSPDAPSQWSNVKVEDRSASIHIVKTTPSIRTGDSSQLAICTCIGSNADYNDITADTILSNFDPEWVYVATDNNNPIPVPEYALETLLMLLVLLAALYLNNIN